MAEKANKKKRKDLVVGLDFGTTHTGISFAMTTFGKVVTFNIDEWPALDGSMVNARKTPTHIAYESGEASRLWGYQAESHANLCAWMKYHLDKNSPITQYDDPLLTEAMRNGLLSLQGTKTAVDVTADYLSEVFTFTMKRLEIELGEGILNVTSIKWWLAKPAVWDGEAEMRLEGIVKQAAKNFGGAREKDEFNFVTEPEAAAFSLLGYELEDQFKEGSTILVCDCGGGTVDVAVFRVISPPPDTEFEELIRGQGGKCGAAFIDCLFQQFMEKRFGDAYRAVKREDKMTGSKFMKAFEINKKKFDEGASLTDMPLRMENVSDEVSTDHYHRRDGQVMLTEEDMKEIFEPVVGKIIGLIREQEKAAKREKRARISELLLVGGLGRSPYLQARVRKWCTSESISKDIRLRIPKSKNSWGAVSHGAVLRGLNKVKIERRIARIHYGIPCMLPFRPGFDKEEERYISPFDGRNHYAKNCVLWFINAGTVINQNTTESRNISLQIKKGEKAFSTEIVSCKDKKAPRKYTEAVKKVGKLDVDLTGVEMDNFQTRETYNGGTIIKFDYKIVQTMGSSQGSLLFKALTVGGEHLGLSEIKLSPPER